VCILVVVLLIRVGSTSNTLFLFAFLFVCLFVSSAGHAYLMRSAGEDLRKKGYRNPVLWLSPLGGWTKSDDVPLDVRVKQHEEVLNAGVSHPGGLDPATTVMAIWPSPMVYAGPTEVQFHAKSRRSAGASYFVVGRDPAGMKGSMDAVAHPDDDLYDGNHGRYVLRNSPGIGDMKMLSFVKVVSPDVVFSFSVRHKYCCIFDLCTFPFTTSDVRHY
jgi:ATP sulfurylase